MPADQDLPVRIRSFSGCDQEACQKLYVEGLIGGALAENDTGLDIDNIHAAYMSAGNHFWVAESEQGEIIGMVGVQHHEEGTGEIRRLRVRQDVRRRGVGTHLLEAAIKFCKERGYLKVALDTFVEREAALKLFEKFRFRHERTKSVGGKELLYFYLDLYTSDAPPRSKP